MTLQPQTQFLRDRLAQIEDQRLAFSVSELIKVIDSLPPVEDQNIKAHRQSEKSASAAEALANFEREYQKFLLDREGWHNWKLENFKQTVSLSQASIRNLGLINGGAAIALLAYVGQLASRGGTYATPIVEALQLFVSGVAFAAISLMVAYVCQLCYGLERAWIQKLAVTLHVTAVLAGLASLGLFVSGGSTAENSFRVESRELVEGAVRVTPEKPKEPSVPRENITKNAPPYLAEPVAPPRPRSPDTSQENVRPAEPDKK